MEGKIRIIVWGSDNYNTLGVIRSLGGQGFDVTLLLNGHKIGLASASKYCDHVVEKSNLLGCVEYLTKNYPDEPCVTNRPLIIPGGDAVSVAMAKNYDVLNKKFYLMTTSDPKVLLKVTDKNEMGRVAKEAGFLIPKSQKYKVGDTSFEVPFPVILKPVYSVGRKEFKTKVFRTKKDFIHFAKYLNPNNRYIMQQFIEREHDIVVYGCRVPSGRTVLAGHHTLERWSDDGGGSYGHLSPEVPQYLNPEAIAKFLEMIDYYGLFSAEYGYKDGKAYFYEINLRNDGFTHLTYQAGANLPLLWVSESMQLGLSVPEKMTQNVVGINEIYDVINVFRGRISWKRYKSDKAEAKAFHFYDPNDIEPYKTMHKRMYWEVPFRAILKTARPYIVWLLNKLK